MTSVGKLHWGNSLINGAYQVTRKVFAWLQKIISGVQLITKIWTSTQATSWNLEVINFLKTHCLVYRPEHDFRKSRDQIDKVIHELYLWKDIPNVTINLISCQQSCKWNLGTSDCDLRMRECSKCFFKTLIWVSKFN